MLLPVRLLSDAAANCKTLGERAAVHFMVSVRPRFSLVRLLPTFTLGPRGLQMLDSQQATYGNIAGACAMDARR